MESNISVLGWHWIFLRNGVLYRRHLLQHHHRLVHLLLSPKFSFRTFMVILSNNSRSWVTIQEWNPTSKRMRGKKSIFIFDTLWLLFFWHVIVCRKVRRICIIIFSSFNCIDQIQISQLCFLIGYGYIHIHKRVPRGVMVIVVRNGYSNTSSNP